MINLLTLAVMLSLSQEPDAQTVGLWLFDETPYPNVTLTDAGPLRADLRLSTPKKALPAEMAEGKAGLGPGKFGRALIGPLPAGVSVIWPENMTWQDGGTSFASDRGNEVPERFNIGYLDWTMEFWLQGDRPQEGRGVLWELKNEVGPKHAPPGVNALLIDAGRGRLILSSRHKHGVPKVDWNVELALPADAATLNDGGWHHLAVTFTAAERQARLYVDGKPAPLPDKGGFLPLIGLLVSMKIGGEGFAGGLDEFRISTGVRYKEAFTPPGSFSRLATPPPAAITLPLLFGAAPPPGPVALGGRKHLFIDGALLEKQENVAFNVHSPVQRETTDFRNQHPWEASPRFGAAIPDVCSVWDDGDRLTMLYTNGGMWGGKPHAVCLAESTDGLRWTKPEVGLQSWDGSTRNNIVLRIACQGTVIRDPRPGIPDGDRYKFLAWCMNRGFYVFTSSDARRWRRNETLALPFDPDGSIEVYWDDQAGVYRGYFRALGAGHPENRDFRAVVRAAAPDVMKPWPFAPSKAPQWHVFASPKPSGGEFPIIETGGEVYRMKGTKYPWAPDVYLAFPWRYKLAENIRPGSFLMVSRDGERWTRYEAPYYFAAGDTVDGRTVREALMEQGMVRRGDRIWQYGTIRFTEHAGALYGGVEHEGGIHDRMLRLQQRLDGFVSLDGGPQGGWALTRPLTFAGSTLRINYEAAGSLKVQVIDEAGKTVAESMPATGDAVSHEVQWTGGSPLRGLEGKPVRLRFELQNAKLYAFQFGG